MKRYKSKYQENKQKLKEEVYISELQEIVKLINNIIQKMSNNLSMNTTSEDVIFKIKNLIDANETILGTINFEQQSLEKETV
jgi:hypothetical protein